ncbi:hypothetical protein ACOME3_007274 [Neoechinorhynchus agilis]
METIVMAESKRGDSVLSTYLSNLMANTRRKSKKRLVEVNINPNDRKWKFGSPPKFKRFTQNPTNGLKHKYLGYDDSTDDEQDSEESNYESEDDILIEQVDQHKMVECSPIRTEVPIVNQISFNISSLNAAANRSIYCFGDQPPAIDPIEKELDAPRKRKKKSKSTECTKDAFHVFIHRKEKIDFEKN